jgi:hypothetical protein
MASGSFFFFDIFTFIGLFIYFGIVAFFGIFIFYVTSIDRPAIAISAYVCWFSDIVGHRAAGISQTAEQPGEIFAVERETIDDDLNWTRVD